MFQQVVFCFGCVCYVDFDFIVDEIYEGEIFEFVWIEDCSGDLFGDLIFDQCVEMEVVEVVFCNEGVDV